MKVIFHRVAAPALLALCVASATAGLIDEVSFLSGDNVAQNRHDNFEWGGGLRAEGADGVNLIGNKHPYGGFLATKSIPSVLHSWSATFDVHLTSDNPHVLGTADGFAFWLVDEPPTPTERFNLFGYSPMGLKQNDIEQDGFLFHGVGVLVDLIDDEEDHKSPSVSLIWNDANRHYPVLGKESPAKAFRLESGQHGCREEIIALRENQQVTTFVVEARSGTLTVSVKSGDKPAAKCGSVSGLRHELGTVFAFTAAHTPDPAMRHAVESIYVRNFQVYNLAANKEISDESDEDMEMHESIHTGQEDLSEENGYHEHPDTHHEHPDTHHEHPDTHHEHPDTHHDVAHESPRARARQPSTGSASGAATTSSHEVSDSDIGQIGDKHVHAIPEAEVQEDVEETDHHKRYEHDIHQSVSVGVQYTADDEAAVRGRSAEIAKLLDQRSAAASRLSSHLVGSGYTLEHMLFQAAEDLFNASRIVQHQLAKTEKDGVHRSSVVGPLEMHSDNRNAVKRYFELMSDLQHAVLVNNRAIAEKLINFESNFVRMENAHKKGAHIAPSSPLRYVSMLLAMCGFGYMVYALSLARDAARSHREFLG